MLVIKARLLCRYIRVLTVIRFPAKVASVIRVRQTSFIRSFPLPASLALFLISINVYEHLKLCLHMVGWQTKYLVQRYTMKNCAMSSISIESWERHPR